MLTNIPPEVTGFFGLAAKVVNSQFLLDSVKLIITGIISAMVTLNTFATDIAVIKTAIAATDNRLTSHEVQNREYRERMESERRAEDRKWEGRITRMESCFIERNCGMKK